MRKAMAALAVTCLVALAGCSAADAGTQTDNQKLNSKLDKILANQELIKKKLGIVDPVPVKPSTPTTPTGPVTPVPPTGDSGATAAAKLNWGTPLANSDEFNGTGKPDASKWGLYDGAGHNGNGKRTPAAFSVANGVVTNHGDANNNTGGMAAKVSSGTTYRVEARMRVYNAGGGSGAQYHPVLIMWPNNDSWPQGGEDDFAEFNVGETTVQSFIHHPNQGSGSAQSQASIKLDPTQWHNYAMERTSTTIKGYVDGVQWFSYTTGQTNGPVPGPMHFCFQLDSFAQGSHQGANQDMDWVRFYAMS